MILDGGDENEHEEPEQPPPKIQKVALKDDVLRMLEMKHAKLSFDF